MLSPSNNVRINFLIKNLFSNHKLESVNLNTTRKMILPCMWQCCTCHRLLKGNAITIYQLGAQDLNYSMATTECNKCN